MDFHIRVSRCVCVCSHVCVWKRCNKYNLNYCKVCYRGHLQL